MEHRFDSFVEENDVCTFIGIDRQVAFCEPFGQFYRVTDMPRMNRCKSTVDQELRPLSA